MKSLTKTDGVTLQMRVVGLLYGAAYLEGRTNAGLPLSRADEKRLAELRELLAGDTNAGRRRHRRVASSQPALIKIGARYLPALILNMSAGGFLLASSVKVEAGQRVQVKVGSAEVVEYHFPCEVRHVYRPRGAYYLGLAFNSIPLEVRHGGTEVEETPAPVFTALAQA
jgi:hypothetical protein